VNFYTFWCMFFHTFCFSQHNFLQFIKRNLVIAWDGTH